MDMETLLVQHKPVIEDWFAQEFRKSPPPPYCSVDLRDATYKISPVDTNLFSAGFNHLHHDCLDDAIAAMRRMLQAQAPNCRRIVVVCESHTRNLGYYENVASLQHIIQLAGYEVDVASLLSEINRTQIIQLPSKRELKLSPLSKVQADLIFLNNDLAEGVPADLETITTQIIPPMVMGWHHRKKSEHFKHYQDVAREFADVLKMDCWLINPYFDAADNIDFVNREGELTLEEKTTSLLLKIQKKYVQYNIEQPPFVVIKANAGSYGIGVLTVQYPQQIIGLNRKQRTKMAISKGHQPIRSVLLQEGVYTDDVFASATAEPVIYMIGNTVIGGFYRYHKDKCANENLNSPGMEFMPLAQQEIRYRHKVIARLAAVAAAREIKESLCKNKSV